MLVAFILMIEAVLFTFVCPDADLAELLAINIHHALEILGFTINPVSFGAESLLGSGHGPVLAAICPSRYRVKT